MKKAYILIEVPNDMPEGKYSYTLSLDSKSSSCHNLRGKTELTVLPKNDKQEDNMKITLNNKENRKDVDRNNNYDYSIDDIDSKMLFQKDVELADFSERLRNNQLTPEEEELYNRTKEFNRKFHLD